MIGTLVVILSFLSGALYGMESDLVVRGTTGQKLCPKDQFSPVPPPSANNSVGWLTPYVRKACYGAFPLLAAGSDVPLSSLFPTAYAPTNVTDSFPPQYQVLAIIAGLVSVAACAGCCATAYLQKTRAGYVRVKDEVRSEGTTVMNSNRQLLPNYTSVLATAVDVSLPRTYAVGSSVAIPTKKGKALAPEIGSYPLLPVIGDQDDNDESSSDS